MEFQLERFHGRFELFGWYEDLEIIPTSLSAFKLHRI